MNKYTEVERRNKVYKYFVLANGTSRKDITWGWIVLCSTELQHLCPSQTVISMKQRGDLFRRGMQHVMLSEFQCEE